MKFRDLPVLGHIRGALVQNQGAQVAQGRSPSLVVPVGGAVTPLPVRPAVRGAGGTPVTKVDRPLIKIGLFSLEASARPASNEGQKSRGGKGEAKRAGRERPRSRSTLDAFRRLRLLIRRKLKKQGHRTLNIPHMAAGGRGRRLEPKNDRGV